MSGLTPLATRGVKLGEGRGVGNYGEWKSDDEILNAMRYSNTRLPWASPSEERYAEKPVTTLRVSNNATEGISPPSILTFTRKKYHPNKRNTQHITGRSRRTRTPSACFRTGTSTEVLPAKPPEKIQRSSLSPEQVRKC